jgi:hypothetical protein
MPGVLQDLEDGLAGLYLQSFGTFLQMHLKAAIGGHGRLGQIGLAHAVSP